MIFTVETKFKCLACNETGGHGGLGFCFKCYQKMLRIRKGGQAHYVGCYKCTGQFMTMNTFKQHKCQDHKQGGTHMQTRCPNPECQIMCGWSGIKHKDKPEQIKIMHCPRHGFFQAKAYKPLGGQGMRGQAPSVKPDQEV